MRKLPNKAFERPAIIVAAPPSQWNAYSAARSARRAGAAQLGR